MAGRPASEWKNQNSSGLRGSGFVIVLIQLFRARVALAARTGLLGSARHVGEGRKHHHSDRNSAPGEGNKRTLVQVKGKICWTLTVASGMWPM